MNIYVMFDIYDFRQFFQSYAPFATLGLFFITWIEQNDKNFTAAMNRFAKIKQQFTHVTLIFPDQNLFFSSQA